MHRAKLFRNGQSQAVRLPKSLRMPGKEVYARRLGDAVVLLPMSDPWQPLRESLSRFSDDFLVERPVDLPQRRVKLAR